MGRGEKMGKRKWRMNAYRGRREKWKNEKIREETVKERWGDNRGEREEVKEGERERDKDRQKPKGTD